MSSPGDDVGVARDGKDVAARSNEAVGEVGSVELAADASGGESASSKQKQRHPLAPEGFVRLSKQEKKKRKRQSTDSDTKKKNEQRAKVRVGGTFWRRSLLCITHNPHTQRGAKRRDRNQVKQSEVLEEAKSFAYSVYRSKRST